MEKEGDDIKQASWQMRHRDRYRFRERNEMRERAETERLT